jgi:cytochrome c-type biogenesis protein CcmH/NrfF
MLWLTTILIVVVVMARAVLDYNRRRTLAELQKIMDTQHPRKKAAATDELGT